jgi:hypothetical protein
MGLVLGAAALLLAGGREAGATTVDGTMVTNVACATYNSISGIRYNVSYCATATFMVISPCVDMWKWVDDGAAWHEWPAAGSGTWIPMQASGCDVTYAIGIWECSDWTSSFNFTITDQVPINSAFATDVDEFNGNMGVNWTHSFNYNGAPPWNNGTPNGGQGGPLYLRWVLRGPFGLDRSAYVRYAVRIL